MDDDKSMSEQNGWSEYKRLIMTEIEDLKESNKDLRDVVSDLKIEIASLKSKLWVHIIVASGGAASGSSLIEWLNK